MAEEAVEVLPQEEDVGIHVGDTLVIFGGPLNKTVGKLYGFFQDRFSILPNGSTSRLTHINLLDGEPDPDLQIREVMVAKKAIRPGFVNMIDLHPQQFVETFDAEGQPGPVFQVISVNEAQDKAVLKDEAGEEKEYEFAFTGIPRDLPFEVMRVREGPPTEEKKEGVLPQIKTTDVNVSEDDLAEGNGEVDAAPSFVLEEGLVELPVFEELAEVSSSRQLFPDVYQRSEMLSQLIRMLPDAQQKNPIQLKLVRRLVESFLSLRNKVVAYGQTGEPIGIQQTSINTLAELLDKPDVTLSRKIAMMSKVVYSDHSIKGFLDPSIDPNPDFIDDTQHLFFTYLLDSIKKAETIDKEAEVAFGENIVSELPRFFQNLQKYKQQVHEPYLITQGNVAVTEDEDVLRMVIPDFEDTPLTVVNELDAKIKPIGSEVLTKATAFGTARVLKERIGRFTTGQQYRVVEPAEAPAFQNRLVFPRSVLRDLGPIRSGSLAQDMSLALTSPHLLADILNDLGQISDFPTPDRILNFGVNGLIGNVLIEDWLEKQDLPLHGLGDVYKLLHGYGVEHVEWNEKQMKIFEEKINQHLASLKMFINKQREENASFLTNLKYEPQPLLTPEAGARLQSRIESEPLLQKVIGEIREYMGDLAQVDINWFSYVFLQYPDLVLAVLGRDPDMVARERNRFILQQYQTALRNAYLQKRLQEEGGSKPIPNTCPHVASLEACRKVANKSNEPGDVIKTKLLIKLLARYRGPTRDNWVWCKVCNQHLICGHELLQIQEFARPREQEAIHKEILIKFSGGAFAGKNICRECGQGISELDFDQSLEYDDEGRPMMGRAVMEDQDVIQDKKMEDLLSGPADIVDKLDFGSESRNNTYNTFKILCDYIGISPDKADYESMINELEAFTNTLPTRSQYKKEKGKPDYDVLYGVQYLAGVIAVLLLNVQTRVPDYNVFYTNADCREGFFGWPLENTEKRSGLGCITTVAASINLDEYPWNVVMLKKFGDVPKRTEILLKYVVPILETMISNGSMELRLEKKREYRLKTFGQVSDVKRDQIDQTFRPIPYVITEEEAAKEPIVASAATPEKAAVAWVRSAHGLVRKTAMLNELSAFSTTSCCLTNVQKPGAFWVSEEAKKYLPELGTRRLGEPPFRSRTIEPTFYTEKSEVLTGELKETEYYKLFVKVCWQGEFKGYPHDLGLTLTCSNCGLHLPQNPKLPLTDLSLESKGYAEEIQKAEAQIRAHLEAQGVEINKDTFQELLHVAQQKASVVPEAIPLIPTADELVKFLKQIPLRPQVDWIPKLESLQAIIQEITPSTSKVELAEMMAKLMEETQEKERDIRQHLTKENFVALQKIMERPPRECGEAVRSYLLVPFMRWNSNVTHDDFSIPKLYDLDPKAKSDIMDRGLGTHLKPLGSGESVKDLGGLVESKINIFINELRIACARLFPYLRSLTTPGGQKMVDYLIRIYLIGIVHHYIDSGVFLPGTEVGSSVHISKLYEALNQALQKFRQGSNVPSEADIRTYLQLREEQELQDFIRRQDIQTKEQRQLTKTQKILGLGDWAIGGSKGIREYDPEMYERWRQERARAGLVDYDQGQQEGEGFNVDDAGYDVGENIVDD